MCYWDQVSDAIIDAVKIMGRMKEKSIGENGKELAEQSTSSKGIDAILKVSYTYIHTSQYVGERYGYLGPRKRVRISHCITREARRMRPEEEGADMGYKEL